MGIRRLGVRLTVQLAVPGYAVDLAKIERKIHPALEDTNQPQFRGR